jgi:capsular polysaccharide biosynthesis protein
MKKILILILILSTLPAITASAYGAPIVTETYEVSRSVILRQVEKGALFEDFIEITNNQNQPIEVFFEATGDVVPLISSKLTGIIIEPKESEKYYFQIKGTETGEYKGLMSITGGVSEKLALEINVTEEPLNPLYIIELEPTQKNFFLTGDIEFKLDIIKLMPDPLENLSVTYLLIQPDNETIMLESEILNITSPIQYLKTFSFPEEAVEGYYKIQVITKYDREEIITEALVGGKISPLNRKVLGMPVWMLIVITSSLLGILLIFILTRRYIESKKKYKMTLDMKAIPKFDKKFLWLGRIAERKNMAYLDPHKLTVHSIVAGATGGGKSIAAQVLIEEALKQNVCVIVFDPTAQWSGMLRKLEDKKMFTYYQKFGMKKTDARAFPGNIRAIKKANQVIDVEKFFQPGHIQILTLNKLQPKDMDIVVANVIRQIFESDPKEYPTLRTLLVFDEIHRILPKFGGSGEGFVQIERACREFRKWGYGVCLISQVLSDFAGQIKANISTEIQMRTRDEGDLNRIKTKYGEGFLQSLVKASVGVGMFSNPAYNHANPYFINFRPILHNTRRLPDEELEKYNQYNDQVEELEYQIEQLEELKIDTFDLKMELKLVKDKIMVGNFSVVDIYLEGLKPRMAKQWEKLGKKPKKKEVQLVDLEEIKKSVEEAKKASEEAKAKEAEQEKAAAEKAKDPVEELNNKMVAPITFDNGIMISSLKELKEVLPNLDEEIFKIHVNEQKNDIATWFSEQFSKTFGAKIKSIITKEELIKEINEFKGDKKTSPAPAKPTRAKKGAQAKEKPNSNTKPTKPKENK